MHVIGLNGRLDTDGELRWSQGLGSGLQVR